MNRSPLKVTTTMIRAGAVALEQCRALGHQDDATAHVVFAAMLAKSDWSPALRKRPHEVRLANSQRPPMLHTRSHYKGLWAGPYQWYDFDEDSRWHFLRCPSPVKWIRLTDQQWNDSDLLQNIERGHHYVKPLTAHNAVERVRRRTDYFKPQYPK